MTCKIVTDAYRYQSMQPVCVGFVISESGLIWKIFAYFYHTYMRVWKRCIADLECDFEILRMPCDESSSRLCIVYNLSYCCMPSIVFTTSARASAHGNQL